MSIHQTTERFPGPTIQIECPTCLAHDVAAATYDQRVKESYFGVIPLLTTRSTWVVCSACGAKLSSSVRAAELPTRTPGELASLIAHRSTFLQKVLALIALGTVLFPMVGLVMSGVATFANRKVPAWPRTLSRVTLGIATVINLLFVFVLLFAPRS